MSLTLRANGSGTPNLVGASWWNDYYNLLTGVMNDQPVTISYQPASSSGNKSLIVTTNGNADPLWVSHTASPTTPDFSVDKSGNVNVYTDIFWRVTLGGANKNFLVLAPPDGTDTWDLAYNHTDASLSFFDTTSSKTPLRLFTTGNVTVGTNLTVTGILSSDAGNIVSDGLGTLSHKAAAAPAAATTTVVAGTNLAIGAYGYKVTFVTSLGESALGTAATATTTSGNQAVNLSVIPTGPTGTTSRKVYRTLVGGSSYFLLTTLADNTTTTYADTTADGSLGAAAPAHPTQGGILLKNAAGTIVAQMYSDGAVSFGAGNTTTDGLGNLTVAGVITSNSKPVPYLVATGSSTAGRQIFTGTTTPTGANEGDIWINA